MRIEAGTVLYASDDIDEGVAEARAYIKRFGLTREDVRLVKRLGQTLVIAKREVTLINIFPALKGGDFQED